MDGVKKHNDDLSVVMSFGRGFRGQFQELFMKIVHYPIHPQGVVLLPTVFKVITGVNRIGWAMLIFLCAYLSNVAFSLYYNIKILLQPFNREKAINCLGIVKAGGGGKFSEYGGDQVS